MPLPLSTGASRDIDRSRRVDAYGCALKRPRACTLDIATKPEANESALAPRFLLLASERGEPAQGVDCLTQRARIVTAVIDDRDTVAIRQPDFVGNTLWRDHVGQPHRYRIKI